MTAQAPGSSEWRWVDIGGQQHKLRFEELAQALTRGRLPPFTLVWRAGWLEWLPAAHVPDLSGAVGVRRAGAPILARTDPGAIAPPTPPLAHYATHVPRGTLTIERGEAPVAGVARPPIRTRSGPSVPSEPPPIVGPPVPVRNVMPTLSEDGEPARSNTLRPTGAIPPPPRTVPSPKRPPFSSIPPVGTRPGVPPTPLQPRTPIAPPVKSGDQTNGAAAPPSPGTPQLRPGPALPQVPPIRIPSAPPAPRAPLPGAPSRGVEPPTTPPRNAPISGRGTSSAPPPPSSRRKAAAEAATRAASSGQRGLAAAPALHEEAAIARTAPVPDVAEATEEPADTHVAEAQVPPRAFEAPHLPSVIVTPVPPPPEARSLDVEPPTPRAPPRPAVAAPAETEDASRKVVTRRLPARSLEDVQVAGLSRRTITVLSCAGVLIPGVVLVIAALMKPRHRPLEPSASAASASAAVTATAAPAPPAGCTVSKPAQRIAEAAYLAVPTLVATAPDGTNAAVGLAATKERAVGLIVDPATLAANAVFEQTVTGSTTLSVVPLVRSGTLEFVVDRADATLSSARTVDADKRFTLGVTGDAVSRILGTTRDVVWPRSAQGSAMTTPRIAPLASKGYAVVFREGGQEGSVLLGAVHEDGSKLTELSAIKVGAALVGTPAVGTSGDGVLVAFAAKGKAEEPWHVELAAGKSPDAPLEAHPFALPPGGPGGEAISPAVEGLGDGRFLLQWTEGSAGNRAVRAQLLTADLVCIGDPVTLSTADQNAGQGTLWLKGNRALALFLVKKDASHELWGASLRCQ